MPEGRRRLAAIMFTDMVAFSALTQRDEPLALKLVDEQRRIVRPVFGRFAGREVKTMGDGALVEFDSALDATECAVEFQRQLFERNRDAAGQRIELRVGIHVGDVVQAENDVFGDTVNIASRIEPLAEPGGICVSGPVFDQVRNKIPYPLKAVDHARLKNIETPVGVYRLELPWTPPDLSEPPVFTGRTEEVGRLLQLVSRASRGEGGAAAVTGEDGVGKSRLLEECGVRAERDGARVLRGRVDPGGPDAPFSAWSGAVGAFARDAPHPLLYRACAGCEVEIARLVPELLPRLGRTAEPPAGQEPSERRFFEGVARFLENLSTEGPLVVILDDLQAADSASVHLLEYIAPRLASHRIALLVAYGPRRGPDDRDLEAAVERLVREHRVELVSLPRFDASGSASFLTRLLRGRLPASGGELAEALFKKSGGNPMVLEALVRSLVGEGSLVWTGDGWSTKPGVSIRLPPGIESLARLRLAELSPSSVATLQDAAVLGTPFTLPTLQRMTGSSPQELVPRLEEAIRARILEERPGAGGPPVYGFTDRTIPETLYDGITLARRPEAHARAARALEAIRAEGASVPGAELARHFRIAGEPEKALDFTLAAAQEAAHLYAREEALRQYDTALALLAAKPDEIRRAEVLFNRADQLNLLGRYTEAFRTFEESAEAYEHLGLAKEAGDVHTGIARRIVMLNEPVRALEHLERARRLLEAGPPSLELARMWDVRGAVLFEQVRLAEASESWHRAIDVAGKVGALRVDASARRMLAAIAPPAESGTVWELLDVALANATKADAWPVVADVSAVKALALLHLRGDGRAALRLVEDLIAAARRRQEVMLEIYAKGNLVTYIQWRLGDLPQAEEAALEHRKFVAGDRRRDRPTAIAVLADVALARNDVDRAQKLLWESERLLAEGGDWSERAQTLTALARCALARGKPLSALEHLNASYELCHQAGPPALDAIFLLETLGLLVRAQLDAGEPDRAEASLHELQGLAQALNADLGEAYLARAQGAFYGARGEGRKAVEALERAAGLWQRLGWRYEWAVTARDLAAARRAGGDVRKADALAEQVEEYLTQVGATGAPTR